MNLRCTHSRSSKLGAALAIVLGAATFPAVAAPDLTIDLPQGLACPNFDLRVEITGNPSRVSKEFHDRAGKVVRTLTAGKGDALTLINLLTGSSISLRPNGAVQNTKFNSDGTQTVSSMGHNVLILFPGDVPAGPTTTLYVGRFVYTVDTSGVFILQSSSGRSSDLCAALSG